jgi:hypothetical protein
MDIKEIASVLTWYAFDTFVEPHKGYGMLVKDEGDNVYSAGQYRYECDSVVGHHQILGAFEHPDQPILKVVAYAHISELISSLSNEVIMLGEENDILKRKVKSYQETLMQGRK